MSDPCLAKSRDDIRPALALTNLVAAVGVVELHIVLAHEHEPFPVEGHVVDGLRDPDAAAHRGDEVALIQFGDSLGEVLLPVGSPPCPLDLACYVGARAVAFLVTDVLMDR